MTQSNRPDEIEALIAEFQRSGMRELHVRADGFELYLSSDPNAAGIGEAGATPVHATPFHAAPPAQAPAPQAQPAPAPAAAGAPKAAQGPLPEGALIVRAPYLGTFYRAPKPGQPPYVEIGSMVTPETEMCLVEVMKLFTAVRASVSGRVHAILAKDGEMVEADQPLFAILPA